jgi:hypothetical protein
MNEPPNRVTALAALIMGLIGNCSKILMKIGAKNSLNF